MALKDNLAKQSRDSLEVRKLLF